MSRRPLPGADKSEQNRATLKQLVKLEVNKSCADCKRNKHPRWASWNIGIFICIRCSGIHRGMGTHISRVKSVDLDSWTDEQMASMIKWGNARANKYWEAKLAEGHVPNEAKIENFIRTKYDSRRWVMDGPMPDPSALGDGTDDDVPLNVVQENLKARMDHAVSQQHARNGSNGGGIARPPVVAPTAAVRQPQVDLFGDDPPTRPNTTEPALAARLAPKESPAAPPKQTRPGESLLGLDFSSSSQSAHPVRAASTGLMTSDPRGRTDLKQSILSLYASKPAALSAEVRTTSFTGVQSPPLTSPNTSALHGLSNAFSPLSLAPGTFEQPKTAPFSNFSPPTGHGKQPSVSKISAPSSLLSGGAFFDAKPTPPPKTTTSPRPPQQINSDTEFGEFSSATTQSGRVTSMFAPTIKATATNALTDDLFDISAPNPPPKASGSATTSPSFISSAFNLSQPSKPVQRGQEKPNPTSGITGLNNMDAWGSSAAWAASDGTASDNAPSKATSVLASTAPQAAPKQPPRSSTGLFDAGWADETQLQTTLATTKAIASEGAFSVQQDEEFGGWSHASPVTTTPGTRQVSGAAGGGGSGGGGQDDLFGNVWG